MVFCVALTCCTPPTYICTQLCLHLIWFVHVPVLSHASYFPPESKISRTLKFNVIILNFNDNTVITNGLSAFSLSNCTITSSTKEKNYRLEDSLCHLLWNMLSKRMSHLALNLNFECIRHIFSSVE